MTGTSDSPGKTTTDVCLTLLSNPLRRAVLLSIYDREADDGEKLPIEEAVTGPMTERVEVALYHHHLPKLEESGVVQWDRGRGTVAEGAAFEEISPFINCLDGNRERLPDDWRSDSDR